MAYLRHREDFREAIKIAESLKRISGGNLLDAATGDGDFIQVLMTTLKEYESVIGIDRSQKEIDKAKKTI